MLPPHRASQFPSSRTTLQSNLRDAEALQRDADAANHDVRYGVTKFSDWTREEFSAWATYRMMHSSTNYPNNTYPNTPDYPRARVRVPPPNSTTPPPLSVDWRSKGVITAVRNQGQCGDCWAFAATEEAESMAAMAG